LQLKWYNESLFFAIENVYLNATIEISKLAKEIKNDVKVIVLSMDNQESKLKRLGVALKDSIKNGNWIIVENAHLLNDWPKDALKLLYVRMGGRLLFLGQKEISIYN
jgi:hypothetical protein